MSHIHTAMTTTRARAFSGSVAKHASQVNRSAHGGIAYTEVCSCGARREVAANAGQCEYGDWATTSLSIRPCNRRLVMRDGSTRLVHYDRMTGRVMDESGSESGWRVGANARWGHPDASMDERLECVEVL